MKLRALILAAALAACGQPADQAKGPAQGEPPNPFDLNIEIGRYSVMLSQVHSLSADRPGAAEGEVTQPRDLARRLREVVWEYNLERSSLCARGLFTEVACGPAYQPVWIGEGGDTAPTIDEIANRSRAVGEEVTRFWDAVCEDARSRAASDEERQYVCAIE